MIVPEGFLRAYLIELMDKLSEVRWDRCAGDSENGVVFGWIDRVDGKADFVLIRWEDGQSVGLTTSSARFSAEYARRMTGTDATHQDCLRVENEFPEVANFIALGSASRSRAG